MPSLNVLDNGRFVDATTYSLVNGWDNVITDCLGIQTQNPPNDQFYNRCGIISTELTPNLINSPVQGTFLGYRIVLPAKHRDRNDMMVSIVIFEQYPNPNRIWRNTWNGDTGTWTGYTVIGSTLDSHPVGSFYISMNGASPSALFGGSWTQISDARFLCAWTAAGGGGGENQHVLTTAEMPSHFHYTQGNLMMWRGSGGNTKTEYGSAMDTDTHFGKNFSLSAGNNAAHNNMPLYITTFMWYRTA